MDLVLLLHELQLHEATLAGQRPHLYLGCIVDNLSHEYRTPTTLAGRCCHIQRTQEPQLPDGHATVGGRVSL